MKWPTYYFYLLIGFSVSNLGNWIYLIALNVFIWNLTNSPAAVAGLYIIGPFIRIICNFFAGSIIDRSQKKPIVIWTDIIRGIIVCLMPFADSLFIIYLLIAMTNVASSFFGPSSMFLISTLIHDEDKQRFNSLNSTFSSGAFMIGPAIAGGIIAISSTSIAMWTNGISFFICALFLTFIPNKEEKTTNEQNLITISMVKKDMQLVLAYSKKIRAFSLFLCIYSISLMIAFALDSQEMTFLLEHLNVSESLYGLSVTIAGIGSLIGGIVATVLAKTFSVKTYIGVGFPLTLFSYLSFYATDSFTIALISFIFLGFFMAFSNAGYATLFQTTIEPTIIGRFTSIVSLYQSVLQISFTLIIGLLCEWYSIQAVTVTFSMLGFLLSLYVCKLMLRK